MSSLPKPTYSEDQVDSNEKVEEAEADDASEPEVRDWQEANELKQDDHSGKDQNEDARAAECAETHPDKPEDEKEELAEEINAEKPQEAIDPAASQANTE